MYIDDLLFVCVGSLVTIIGYLLYCVIKLENREDTFGNLSKNEFIELTVILNDFLHSNRNYDKIFNICKVNTNILALTKWLISEDRSIPDINNVLDFSDSEYDSDESNDSNQSSESNESSDSSSTTNHDSSSDKDLNSEEESNQETEEDLREIKMTANENSNKTSNENISESNNKDNEKSNDDTLNDLVKNLEQNIENTNNLEEINLQETKDNQKICTREVNLLTDYSLYLDHFGRSNFSPNITLNRYITIKQGDVVFFINYAQLNFFKWIIKVGLYQYIEDNKEILMEQFQQFKNKKYNNKSKSEPLVLRSTPVINDKKIN